MEFRAVLKIFFVFVSCLEMRRFNVVRNGWNCFCNRAVRERGWANRMSTDCIDRCGLFLNFIVLSVVFRRLISLSLT